MSSDLFISIYYCPDQETERDLVSIFLDFAFNLKSFGISSTWSYIETRRDIMKEAEFTLRQSGESMTFEEMSEILQANFRRRAKRESVAYLTADFLVRRYYSEYNSANASSEVKSTLSPLTLSTQDWVGNKNGRTIRYLYIYVWIPEVYSPLSESTLRNREELLKSLSKMILFCEGLRAKINDSISFLFFREEALRNLDETDFPSQYIQTIKSIDTRIFSSDFFLKIAPESEKIDFIVEDNRLAIYSQFFPFGDLKEFLDKIKSRKDKP